MDGQDENSLQHLTVQAQRYNNTVKTEEVFFVIWYHVPGSIHGTTV